MGLPFQFLQNASQPYHRNFFSNGVGVSTRRDDMQMFYAQIQHSQVGTFGEVRRIGKLYFGRQ